MRFCVDLVAGEVTTVTARLPPRGLVAASLLPTQGAVVSIGEQPMISAAVLPKVTAQIVALPQLMGVQVVGERPDYQVSAVAGGGGLPGPPGPASDVVDAVCEVALGGQRVVRFVPGGKINYASSDRPDDGNQILGITTGAGSAGALIQVRIGGYMDEPSWNWELGQVYCGLNGVLTQTPPDTGFMCRVGRATKPTQIIVGVEEAIILA